MLHPKKNKGNCLGDVDGYYVNDNSIRTQFIENYNIYWILNESTLFTI